MGELIVMAMTYHGKKEVETGAGIKGDFLARKLARRQYPPHHTQPQHTYGRGASCKAKMAHSRNEQNNTQEQPYLGGQVATVRRCGRVGHRHWRLDLGGSGSSSSGLR